MAPESGPRTRRARSRADVASAAARGGRRRRGRPTTLRAGFLPYLGIESLRLFLAALHEREPDLELEISHGLSGEQVRRVRAGELDIGIFRSPGDEAELELEPLFPGEPMAAFVPAGHPLAAKRVVRPADVRDQDLVMFPRAAGPAMYDWWLTTLEAAGYRFRHVTSGGGAHPQDLMVAVVQGRGLGMANVEFASAAGVGTLVLVRLLDPPLRVPGTVVGWRASRPPGLDRAIAAVRQTARELHRQSSLAATAPPRDACALTPRELEVLELAADGCSARQIAARLVISPATVKTHFENIYPKLGATDRTGAVAAALRQRLIT